MGNIRKKILWAIVLVFFILLVPYCKRWWEIDRCYDRGGAWNDETETCEYDSKEQK